MVVNQLMTKEPTTVAPTDTLERARLLMEAGGFRRVPVVDQGKLVGIVSDRDIRQHAGHLTHTRVDAAMTQRVITVTPSTMMEKAAHLLLKNKVGGLPVVDDNNRVVGIVTTSDILESFVRMLGITEEGVSRIDLAIDGDAFEMSSVVQLISGEIGQVVGAGTYRADWGESQVSYVRVPSAEAKRIADMLTEKGFKVLAVHS
jgi:acetoin utilization protein AcuB